jgi:hypothetical protein
MHAISMSLKLGYRKRITIIQPTEAVDPIPREEANVDKEEVEEPQTNLVVVFQYIAGKDSYTKQRLISLNFPDGIA